MPLCDGLTATRRIRAWEQQTKPASGPSGGGAAELDPTTSRGRPPSSRDERPPLFIVALTAVAGQSDREDCAAAGMNDFLSKPVKPETVRQVLSRYDRRAEGRAGSAGDGGGRRAATFDG